MFHLGSINLNSQLDPQVEMLVGLLDTEGEIWDGNINLGLLP